MHISHPLVAKRPHIRSLRAWKRPVGLGRGHGTPRWRWHASRVCLRMVHEGHVRKLALLAPFAISPSRRPPSRAHLDLLLARHETAGHPRPEQYGPTYHGRLRRRDLPDIPLRIHSTGGHSVKRWVLHDPIRAGIQSRRRRVGSRLSIAASSLPSPPPISLPPSLPPLPSGGATSRGRCLIRRLRQRSAAPAIILIVSIVITLDVVALLATLTCHCLTNIAAIRMSLLSLRSSLRVEKGSRSSGALRTHCRRSKRTHRVFIPVIFIAIVRVTLMLVILVVIVSVIGRTVVRSTTTTTDSVVTLAGRTIALPRAGSRPFREGRKLPAVLGREGDRVW